MSGYAYYKGLSHLFAEHSMKKWAYYNDIDPFCCEWVGQLIAAELIAPGEVDSRPIQEVQPDDLRGFSQVHMFCGIGGWSYAARLAGWPDDRAIWTGSCPCQPFSLAGKGLGTNDPRHLWPDFFRLIRACRPSLVMGEQTSAKAGYAWLDGVGSDLESEDYAWGACDIPACSVNAPHIRNRLYWVAEPQCPPEGRWGIQRSSESAVPANQWSSGESRRRGVGTVGLDDDTTSPRLSEAESGKSGSIRDKARRGESERRSGNDGGLDNPHGQRFEKWPESDGTENKSELEASRRRDVGGSGFWDSYELIGPDPKGQYRRVKPGVRLLVDGLPGRVGMLRGLGNAIVPEQAAQVIAAWMQATA